MNWDNALSAARYFTDASQGQIVKHEQYELWPRRQSACSTPEDVKLAMSRAATYAEAMHILKCSRGRLVRWLEDDRELREGWRERLASERKERVLAQISQCQDHKRIANKDLRWLARHYPVIYRSLGFSASSGRALI